MKNPFRELFEIQPLTVNLRLFFPGNVFLGYFGLCLCISDNRVSCSNVNLGQYLSDGSQTQVPCSFLSTGGAAQAGAGRCCVAAFHLLRNPFRRRALNNKVDLLSPLVSGCQFLRQSCWLRSSVWCWATALQRSCLKSSFDTQTPLKSSRQSASGH